MYCTPAPLTLTSILSLLDLTTTGKEAAVAKRKKVAQAPDPDQFSSGETPVVVMSARQFIRICQIVLQFIGGLSVLYLLLFGFPQHVGDSSIASPIVSIPTAVHIETPPPPPPVAGCTDDQLREARAMLAAYVESIQHTDVKFRHGFTPAEYAAFPCTQIDQSANIPTRVETDIVFVMISSSKELERSVAHRQTWASHTTMLMFADVNGTAAGFIAHPEASGPAYGDAQHRTLRGLQYAVQHFPNAR